MPPPRKTAVTVPEIPYFGHSAALLASPKSSPVPQTLTEKIIQSHSIGLTGKYVKSGHYVTISPRKCMTHDNSWPVALKFMSMGATKIHDPTQLVMALDYDVQNKSEKNLTKYRQIEEFAKKHGVGFFPAGRGIGHQIMVEEGYALQKVINQLDGMLDTAEKELGQSATSEVPSGPTELVEGFRDRYSGEVLWIDVQGCNTDAIYPGKYTYEELSKERMAEVCMENYDPNFSSIAQRGDVLVSGFSFGVGSSREQAASSILANGIELVVAGSFASVYSKNAMDNGLCTLSSPKLVHRLREALPSEPKPALKARNDIAEPYGNKQHQESLDSPPPIPIQPAQKELTIRTGWKLVWDVKKSQIEVTESHGTVRIDKVLEVPPTGQEIIAAGGLEPWIKSQIAA